MLVSLTTTSSKFATNQFKVNGSLPCIGYSNKFPLQYLCLPHNGSTITQFLFCSHAKQMQIPVRKNVVRCEVSDCTKALVKVENGNYLQAEWPLGEMPKPEEHLWWQTQPTDEAGTA